MNTEKRLIANNFSEYASNPTGFASITGIPGEIAIRLPGFTDFGIDGDVLIDGPGVLSKQGVIVARCLKVTGSELTTHLQQVDANSAIWADVRASGNIIQPGDVHLGESAVETTGTQLEGRVRWLGDELVILRQTISGVWLPSSCQ